MTKIRKIGFTLIELMGIIIILSLLSLLVIPGVDLAIKQFKTQAYEGQLKNIKLAANDWALDNVPKYALKDGDALTITLAQLKMSNLVDHNIINPKTDEPFADDMIINIVRENNNFTFDVDAASGAQIGLSDNAPIITLKGNYVEKRYENHGYVDPGVTAKTSAGVAIPATSITKVIRKNGVVVPSINDAAGTYTIAYSVTDNGITRTVYRIVMFEELKPSTPAICFTFNEATKTLTGYDPLIAGCGYDVIIPRTINGTSVEIIADGAFNSKQIKSVIIPSSVITLDGFAYNDITIVEIPNSVVTIGTGAFYDNDIVSLTIPSSVVTIGGSSFANNDLTNVDIPSSVTTIGGLAFYSNQLSSVVIPNSVVTIGSEAFAYNQITSLVLSNSLTTIGYGAFVNNQIPNVIIPSSVTTIDFNAFYNNLLTSVIIPNSVTTIGTGAFMNNRLTSVTLSNNLTVLESSSFRNNMITSLTIPNSVTTIKNTAFYMNEIGSLILPSSVTTLGESAFASNQIASLTIQGVIPILRGFSSNNITSLTIPAGTTTIENSAFYNNQIATLSIPSTVTIIAQYAFDNNSLTTLTIPNNVTTIGNYAFSTNLLTNLDIGSGVTSIDSRAFYINYIPQGSAIIRRASGSVTLGTEVFSRNGVDRNTTITPTYIP